jgi:hypothetical protein
MRSAPSKSGSPEANEGSLGNPEVTLSDREHDFGSRRET